MRYITVPKNAVLEHLPADASGALPELPFVDFVRKVLVTDNRVTQNDQALTQFMEIADAVKSLKPGDELALQDETHEFLATLAKTFQYSGEAKLALLPMIKAITSAVAKSTIPTDSAAGAPSRE